MTEQLTDQLIRKTQNIRKSLWIYFSSSKQHTYIFENMKYYFAIIDGAWSSEPSEDSEDLSWMLCHLAAQRAQSIANPTFSHPDFPAPLPSLTALTILPISKTQGKRETCIYSFGSWIYSYLPIFLPLNLFLTEYTFAGQECLAQSWINSS